MMETGTVAQTRLLGLASQLKDAQEGLSYERARTTNEIDMLTAENTNLRARRAKFKELTLTPQMQASKDFRLVAVLEQRVAFYEEQLAEADDTLEKTKMSWAAVNGVLLQQIQVLESSLRATKSSLTESLSDKGVGDVNADALSRKLAKAERMKDKLSDLANTLEVQLLQRSQEVQELRAALEQEKAVNQIEASIVAPSGSRRRSVAVVAAGGAPNF
jgi:hypothetical protein